jgi:hypothetical protein
VVRGKSEGFSRVFEGFSRVWAGECRGNWERIEGKCDCGVGRGFRCACGASLLLAVVRVWDHVCAPRGVECGFLGGDCEYFFYFLDLGGVRGKTMLTSRLTGFEAAPGILLDLSFTPQGRPIFLR